MPEPALKFRCPEKDCDKSFNTEQGLKRHQSEKHGAEPHPATLQKQRRRARQEETLALITDSDEDSVGMQVRSRLLELASPLEEQLGQINRRLVEINREAIDLRDAKNQIELM